MRGRFTDQNEIDQSQLNILRLQRRQRRQQSAMDAGMGDVGITMAGLQSQITSEATARIAADTAEITARNNAIASTMNAEVAARSLAVTNEGQARVAADNAEATTRAADDAVRLRFDAAQTLTAAQRTQAKANLGLPNRIENYTGVTDAAGLYTVTFAAAFANIPSVQPVLVGNDTDTVFRLVSRSKTGFQVHAYKRSSLTVLTLQVLSYGITNVAAVTCDVRVEGT